MTNGRIAASHAEQQFDVSASARTLAFGGALTVGTTSVVAITHYDNTSGTSATVTVSGSVNGAYTLCGSYTRRSIIEVSIWIKENQQASSAETITVTPSAAAYLSLSLEEFAGRWRSGGLRDQQGNSTVANTAHTTPNVSADVGDLVFVVLDPTNGTITSVDSPFTLITNLGPIATGEGIATAIHFPASAAETVTFRTSGATDSVQSIISLRQRPSTLGLMGVGET